MRAFNFHPAVAEWFGRQFGTPTDPQRLGWPSIQAGRHTLISAPTGSGKTLAAFLASLDQLFRQGALGPLPDETQVLYVSPLKALSNDIRKNLQEPLAGISGALRALHGSAVEVRAEVRTGDTPAAQRQALAKKPPHILVTTPESLYLLLTSTSGRRMLATVRTLIVDEIHAMLEDRRGSHLAITMERLEALVEGPLQRIGLSATQKPIEDVARFLVGNHSIDGQGQPDCSIINVGQRRELDLALELPGSPLEAVMSNEIWEEVYRRLTELIEAHRTTLVFVNTRRLAERVTHQLSALLGPERVTSHHGSLSAKLRLDAEDRLKRGELKALVATASLELGIDIGSVDLVCQLGSTHSITTFIQRAGRAEHKRGGLPKARLFPLSRDELVECAALLRCVRRGELDRLCLPEKPLDILAQQIVACSASEDWEEQALFDLIRGAYPYRHLERKEFNDVVAMLANGFSTKRGRRAALIHFDEVNGRIRGRRGSRLLALTSGGAIPDSSDYRVILEPTESFIGSVNEDFAIESLAGDIFQLGNASWRILRVNSGQVRVEDAHGQPPSIPFWLGEAPGRTGELSEAVSELREEIEARLAGVRNVAVNEPGNPTAIELTHLTERHGGFLPLPAQRSGERAGGEGFVSIGPEGASSPRPSPPLRRGEGESSSGLIPRCLTSIAVHPDPLPEARELAGWLEESIALSPSGAAQVADYYTAVYRALGGIPSQKKLVMERFFDESGGMQLVIHSLFGSRLNRAWGLALRKRFCRTFNFELQAAATDDAIVLSLGTQHSFSLPEVFRYLSSKSVRDLLIQALLDAPMFTIRWRWNASRALAVPRQRGGKKLAAPLQRMEAENLIASVFPDQLACPENLPGDREIPDHPLVNQTISDCLTEAMDIDALIELLRSIEEGRIECLARDLPEPSALAHEILNARPYAFLDNAPLEERRTHAVYTRRTLSSSADTELGILDADAIERVVTEARPSPENPDELHEALLLMGLMTEEEIATFDQAGLAEALAESNRAGRLSQGSQVFWAAAERLAMLRAIYPEADVPPGLAAPASTLKTWERSDAIRELVRGRIEVAGPVTSLSLAGTLLLPEREIDAALLALEAEGFVLRGNFHPGATGTEWCDRRLLARIHRLTINRLRAEIQPVSQHDFYRFLLAWQRVDAGHRAEGPEGLLAVLEQFDGYELSLAAWEPDVLPARVADYNSEWLDRGCLSGRLGWGRLSPPQNPKGRAFSPLRSSPLSFFQRENLAAWLVLADPSSSMELAPDTQQVLEVLERSGALFFREIVRRSGLLPSQVELALAELVALGFATADSFDGVRALLVPSDKRPTFGRTEGRRHHKKHVASVEFAGRWSLLRVLAGGSESGSEGESAAAEGGPVVPRNGSGGPMEKEDACELYARTLLRRYGIMFRRLLEREPFKASWYELGRIYRRLEARGEIRGGHFVAGVSGEQFAMPEAVGLLRGLRKAPARGELVVLSGADPLNLVGILTPGPRVAALVGNRILFRDGLPVAVLEAGQVRALGERSDLTDLAIEDALTIGKLPPSLRPYYG